MERKYERDASERRALGAFVKLVRAAESVGARVHRHLALSGLTVSQFGVLEALHHLGPLSQTDLARKVLRSSGNITVVVDNLEKRGLVRRERKTEDRRFLTVHLTDEGRALVREIFPRHAQVVRREMGTLTEKEQEELGRLCRKVGLGKIPPS
jgi:MarR family 2-MHQ and catechol resistance regulon transcriptional repressor